MGEVAVDQRRINKYVTRAYWSGYGDSYRNAVVDEYSLNTGRRSRRPAGYTTVYV